MNHAIRSDIKSLSNQLPALVATRTEINKFKDTVENYAKLLKVEGKRTDIQVYEAEWAYVQDFTRKGTPDNCHG